MDKTKAIKDNEDTILASVENDRTKKEVLFHQYKGKKYIIVRQLWREDVNESWKFSKKIVMFEYEEAESILDQLKTPTEIKENILKNLE